MKNNTKTLAVCGIMTAMSVVLSFIKIFELPYGGAITLFSMVPIAFAGYAYGAKWGLACGTVWGVIECLLGASGTLAYLTDNMLNFMICLLFDYLVAFAVVGLSGVFKNKIKNSKVSFALGAGFAVFLRFVCHFVTGFIIWREYAVDTLSVNEFGLKIINTFSGEGLAAVYSLVYNGSYMLPELVLSVVGALILASIKPLQKELNSTK